MSSSDSSSDVSSLSSDHELSPDEAPMKTTSENAASKNTAAGATTAAAGSIDTTKATEKSKEKTTRKDPMYVSLEEAAKRPLLLINDPPSATKVANPLLDSALLSSDAEDIYSLADQSQSPDYTLFFCHLCKEKTNVHYRETVQCRACGCRIMHKCRDTSAKVMLTAGYGYRF